MFCSLPTGWLDIFLLSLKMIYFRHILWNIFLWQSCCLYFYVISIKEWFAGNKLFLLHNPNKEQYAWKSGQVHSLYSSSYIILSPECHHFIALIELYFIDFDHTCISTLHKFSHTTATSVMPFTQAGWVNNVLWLGFSNVLYPVYPLLTDQAFPCLLLCSLFMSSLVFLLVSFQPPQTAIFHKSVFQFLDKLCSHTITNSFLE